MHVHIRQCSRTSSQQRTSPNDGKTENQRGQARASLSLVTAARLSARRARLPILGCAAELRVELARLGREPVESDNRARQLEAARPWASVGRMEGWGGALGIHRGSTTHGGRKAAEGDRDATGPGTGGGRKANGQLGRIISSLSCHGEGARRTGSYIYIYMYVRMYMYL